MADSGRPSSANCGIWQALSRNLTYLCENLEPGRAMFIAQLTENKGVLGLDEEKILQIRSATTHHEAVIRLVKALEKSGPRNEQGFRVFMGILQKEGKGFVRVKIENLARRLGWLPDDEAVRPRPATSVYHTAHEAPKMKELDERRDSRVLHLENKFSSLEVTMGSVVEEIGSLRQENYRLNRELQSTMKRESQLLEQRTRWEEETLKIKKEKEKLTEKCERQLAEFRKETCLTSAVTQEHDQNKRAIESLREENFELKKKISKLLETSEATKRDKDEEKRTEDEEQQLAEDQLTSTKSECDKLSNELRVYSETVVTLTRNVDIFKEQLDTYLKELCKHSDCQKDVAKQNAVVTHASQKVKATAQTLQQNLTLEKEIVNDRNKMISKVKQESQEMRRRNESLQQRLKIAEEKISQQDQTITKINVFLKDLHTQGQKVLEGGAASDFTQFVLDKAKEFTENERPSSAKK